MKLFSSPKAKRNFVILAIIMPVFLFASAMTLVSAAMPNPNVAVQPAQTADTSMIALGSALAVGLAGLGAGIALSKSGAAAIASLAEKPETFFKGFLVVVLCEAVAIYGVVIAILLWLKM
ncbi:MAG: ATP synthase subunit C [Candidatus Methanomethylicus sp.]|nr:ATP synthase subunit C [Candidatus Methanomethylicus sp.]